MGLCTPLPYIRSTINGFLYICDHKTCPMHSHFAGPTEFGQHCCGEHNQSLNRHGGPQRMPDAIANATRWPDTSRRKCLRRRNKGQNYQAKPWFDNLPRVILVNTTSEPFSKVDHENVPITDEWRWQHMLEPMMWPAAARHCWLFLSSYPKRQVDFYLRTLERYHYWPANVWLGSSVRTQADLDVVTHQYARAPAVHKFLNIQPQIAKINLANSLVGIDWVTHCGTAANNSPEPAYPFVLDWIGEIRHACKAAKVPYFLVGIGTNPHRMKIEAGRLVPAPIRVKSGRGKGWDRWPSCWPLTDIKIVASLNARLARRDTALQLRHVPRQVIRRTCTEAQIAAPTAPLEFTTAR